MEARHPLDADTVTAALVHDEERLAEAMGEGARTEIRGDAGMLITGVPMPTLNGVLTVRRSATATDVAALLDVVASKKLPHSLVMRPGCDPRIVELAAQRGMVEEEPIPLMAMLRETDRLAMVAEHRRMSIRDLSPDEAGIHQSIAAEGFEAPIEMFERLVPARAMARPGFRVYVGTVDGEVVTTALGSTDAGHVGIFNVATPARHRGRGYGAAITARATLDGFEAGASFAYLQSSTMGFKIYERLGFRTVETWSVWISDPSRN